MIKRRTFLKMLGAAVVAPSLPVSNPISNVSAIYGFRKVKFNNEEYGTYTLDYYETPAKPRNKHNPMFSGEIGVWDGVTFIDT